MRWSVLFIVLAASVLLVHAVGGDMDYGRVDTSLLKAVIRVIAEPLGSRKAMVGTAFLVSVPVGSGSDRVHCLITNKHMVGDWTFADGTVSTYRPAVRAFLYDSTKVPAVREVRIPLVDNASKPLPSRVVLHPNPTVDIAVIALEPAVIGSPPLGLTSFDLSYLLPYQKIPTWLTGLGDQVFALGYPSGITSVTTSQPIAKVGYLSTPPGEPFAIDITTESRAGVPLSKRVSGSVMLVDGLLVPGNSGSPLILASELKVRRSPTSNQLEFATEQTKNYIIGIVSMGLDGSGLTLVFSADYIQEALSEFMKARP